MNVNPFKLKTFVTVAPVLLLLVLILPVIPYDSDPITEEEIILEMDTSRDHEGDTFSVVAYDPNTGEIGGAGCSCYGGNINFLNDIIFSPSGTLLGAIHTQAAYTSCNQSRARARMLAGDTPAQIIAYMQANDCNANSTTRQYGIVGIDSQGTITTAGFTGSNNGNWAGNITGIDPNTGIHYAIQGNILDTSTGGGGRQDVLDDMETAFRNATGTLADKLMAALQGAKRVGGDNRCINSGNSGKAAFVRVQKPTDPIGSPYMDLWTYPNISYVEPIDVLQCNYDSFVSTPFCRETVDTFPYSMDFETSIWEEEETCNVRNAWIRSRFSTPTNSTGPGGPNQGALYTFVESSDLGPDNFNTTSIIGSPCFEIPANHSAQLTFDYHMYGTQMGTLSIEASDNGGSSWTTLWSLSGNQGNQWFNDAIVDLSTYSGSTVKLRLKGVTGNGDRSDMAVDDIQIIVEELTGCFGIAKTWNGSNWSPSAPGIGDTVTINGDYDTNMDGNLSACTLTITSGSTLTVQPDNFININGNIVVEGNLIVEHQGSVVQNDPSATVEKIGAGTINVNVTSPILNQRDFMIMGSPMSAETRNGVYNSAFLVLEFIPENFIPHPDVPPGGTNFADDNGDFYSIYNSGPINPGEGYLVRPQSGYEDPAGIPYDFTYSQGTLNNGTITYTNYNNGPGTNPDGTPNIVSNPYPSAIDTDAFLAANPGVDAVYFWEHLTPPGAPLSGSNLRFDMDDISVYNGVMGIPAANDPGNLQGTAPNNVISTAQGFGIRTNGATGSTGTITFSNDMRLTSGNNTLREPEVLPETLLLEVRESAYGYGSFTGIAFHKNGTENLDEGMDTNRLATIVSLYSHLEDGTEQLGIQTLGRYDESTKIPLGFSTQINEEIEYEISLQQILGENLSEATVYLIDNILNQVHNLSASPYTFSSIPGDYNQRFTILFENNSELGTTENVLHSIVLFPNPSHGILHIKSPIAPITSVEIHDVLGKSFSKKSIVGAMEYTLDMNHLESGIYFVTVTTQFGQISQRILKN